MRRRMLKDRNDGRYLTKLDPISKLIPYIMNDRTDAHVYFEESIDLTKVEPFIRQYRKDYGVKIGFMHIMIAAMVRTMSQKPKINRFVAGNKLYARDHIAISYTMKKAMTEKASDAAIKNIYSPYATLHDVVAIVNEEVDKNRDMDVSNDSDILAKTITIMPGFLIKAVLGLIKMTDHLGIMPRSILHASPFHTSMYITNLGSLGIRAVYHHIYNIGTTSLFMAFGIKKHVWEGAGDKAILKKYMDIKVVADERIVDGFYFATAFKQAIKYLENPERLLLPPDQVMEDDQI